jgi:enoyl-CoA hydratase/carnithine racemase
VSGYATIDLAIEHPLATLTLQRPERLNAISRELMGEVTDALARIAADDGVRCVILRGAGRCFSAGFEIADDDAWVEGEGPAAVVDDMRFYMEWERSIFEFEKPIVAAVHSYCLAGACEVMMLCDLAVAADDARFGEPEIRFSNGPPALIMPWIIGMRAAKELLLTGKMIDAQRALQLGMVNEVCAPADLERRARYHALLIAKVSPLAVRLQKRALNGIFEQQGLRHALDWGVTMTGLIDASETEEMKTFSRIRREQGLRAALDWRDEQFREVEDLA